MHWEFWKPQMGTELVQFPLGGETGEREESEARDVGRDTRPLGQEPLKQRGFFALVGVGRKFRAVRLAEGKNPETNPLHFSALFSMRFG